MVEVLVPDNVVQYFGIKLSNGKFLYENQIGSWEILPPEMIVRFDIYTKPKHLFSLKRKNLPKKRFKEFIYWASAEWRMLSKAERIGDKKTEIRELCRIIGWHDGKTAYLYRVDAQTGKVIKYSKPIEEVKLHRNSPYRKILEEEKKKREEVKKLGRNH